MAGQFFVEGLSRQQAKARVLQAVTASGGTLTSQSDDMIAATYSKNASCLITFLLLWLAILPGVLYWFWGKKAQNLLVQLSGDDTGTWVSTTANGKAAAAGEHAVLAAFGQTGGQKVAAAVASGASSAAKSIGSAAVSAKDAAAKKMQAKSEGDAPVLEQAEASVESPEA